MYNKQTILILIFYINSFLVINAQSERDLLIDQTFSSNIGSICEETTGDDSCAGSQLYLILKFTEETITVIEKEISSCKVEHISSQLKYKWELTKDSEIKINTNPKDIEYLFSKDIILKIENKTVVGYKEIGAKKIDRFEFKKQL